MLFPIEGMVICVAYDHPIRTDVPENDFLGWYCNKRNGGMSTFLSV